MALTSAAELAARPDRLPVTRHIWVLVTLISLGGAFELYHLFLTAYIARRVSSKPRNRSFRPTQRHRRS
jgi:hypothetical protein